ncbi:undecaprenyl/decaprenyl-phosphate alpha-N-acetylglucosaminyl 1-phosphate transferase [Patescibacteria group bacterium]|nr:MAG: undecaprenyl/decaprenyl-phosphate alpha-N-acetylglucosaminyl 1-phosphate transferase [Patescibacteria group bacterium]
MIYFLAFVASFLLSLALTPLVRQFALQRGILAYPGDRKIHVKPIPYLGGLAIFGSFLITATLFLPFGRQLGALLLAATVLAVVGAIDDVKGLSPWARLGWQTLAACIALAGGIGITAISNPLGGTIDLTYGRFAVELIGFQFHITPVANLLSILWMVGMVNVINFLDGLDGLASGVSGIAALVIAALSLTPQVDQPLVALLAFLLAGSTLGFLPFNFYPAKIFMGDSGSYFLGLMLAMLAIYSGGKLATILLVLGFTIIDALWAAIRRIRKGVHPFTADREHLHHLLLQAGLSQRLAVIALYLLAGLFGVIALMSERFHKLVALLVLLVVVVVLIASLIRIGRHRQPLQ